MSGSNIRGVTLWAAISPPNRGRRFIAHWTLSTRRRGALDLFFTPAAHPELEKWPYWRKRGWTIERVYVSPVLKV